MNPCVEYVTLTAAHALLLVNIITGYETRNPNVCVFMKRPMGIAIVVGTYRDRADMKYYKIAFRDIDNKYVCFEMVSEGKERHILKYTGERKNFLKYFLNDTTEYNGKVTTELGPVFDEIKDFAMFPEKDREVKPQVKFKMYNYKEMVNGPMKYDPHRRT